VTKKKDTPEEANAAVAGPNQGKDSFTVLLQERSGKVHLRIFKTEEEASDYVTTVRMRNPQLIEHAALVIGTFY
jgi:hypothetical protein